MRRIFAFRFDIDSIVGIQQGVPNLLDLARELDIKFTFFVNMGKSFDWRVMLWDVFVGKRRVVNDANKLSSLDKLGWRGLLITVVRNPDIGLSNEAILHRAINEGHELGLHGGINHSIWQRRLDTLRREEIYALFQPAYEHFKARFGKPRGFASPGFVHNAYVYELVDNYGFLYASDIPGERPFRLERNGRSYRHLQIPVNVIGKGTIPLIEQCLAQRLDDDETLERCIKEICKRDLAVMYGHPAVEGQSIDVLGRLLEWVKIEGYQVRRLEEIAEDGFIF